VAVLAFFEVEGATILVQKFERQANAGDRGFSIDGFLVDQWLVGLKPVTFFPEKGSIS
jgi:hypothetical protein